MKSIIYIVCAGSIIGLFTFVGFIQFAQAETIIEHVAELQGDVEWRAFCLRKLSLFCSMIALSSSMTPPRFGKGGNDIPWGTV